ncbi:unnamed protein product [Cylindrotheca closterium]|uniref:Uncharacterized protein n=1 Tax=Cylindrotheca closterium TaxID=2856 RepID=A0AAD2CUT5_9STRA|nr:unnamed protein product [Cylindrotheca closterium]
MQGGNDKEMLEAGIRPEGAIAADGCMVKQPSTDKTDRKSGLFRKMLLGMKTKSSYGVAFGLISSLMVGFLGGWFAGGAATAAGEISNGAASMNDVTTSGSNSTTTTVYNCNCTTPTVVNSSSTQPEPPSPNANSRVLFPWMGRENTTCYIGEWYQCGDTNGGLDVKYFDRLRKNCPSRNNCDDLAGCAVSKSEIFFEGPSDGTVPDVARLAKGKSSSKDHPMAQFLTFMIIAAMILRIGTTLMEPRWQRVLTQNCSRLQRRT